MLSGYTEGQEIVASGPSLGGDMSEVEVSILQHVSFLVHIIPSIHAHV